jgi:hypothetical protein
MIVDVWRWIDSYINIGILAVLLSMCVPGVLVLSTEIDNERLGQAVFKAGMWLFAFVLFLGFGGAYLMTR